MKGRNGASPIFGAIWLLFGAIWLFGGIRALVAGALPVAITQFVIAGLILGAGLLNILRVRRMKRPEPIVPPSGGDFWERPENKDRDESGMTLEESERYEPIHPK